MAGIGSSIGLSSESVNRTGKKKVLLLREPSVSSSPRLMDFLGGFRGFARPVCFSRPLAKQRGALPLAQAARIAEGNDTRTTLLSLRALSVLCGDDWQRAPVL
jgi:hypothetical protein